MAQTDTDLPEYVPHINNDTSLSLSELAVRWDTSGPGLVQEIKDRQLYCAQFNEEEFNRRVAEVEKKNREEQSRVNPYLRDRWGEKGLFQNTGTRYKIPTWKSFTKNLNNPNVDLETLRFRLEQDVWPAEEQNPKRKAAAWEYYKAKTGAEGQDTAAADNPFFIEVEPGTKWEEVSFELLTKWERIKVMARGRWKYTTFKALGLTKGIYDEANAPGRLFEAMAEQKVRGEPISLISDIDVKVNAKRLRKILKNAFPDVQGETPISKTGDYEPVFNITMHEQYDD